MTAWVSVHPRLPLIGLLVLFLVLATVYNVVSTPFEAPDEIGHFYYILHLMRTGRLPVVPAEGPPPNYEHEGAQPPLYYVGASLFVRVLAAPLRLDLQDDGIPLDVNPHSACARPGVRTNVVYFAHDPHQERFPYLGRVRVLHVVRFWSSLLATATVAGVFVAARLAFPGVPGVAWLAVGLAAFTPEFLFTSGAVSNDNLVVALTTWGVCLALRLARGGVRWPHGLGLGALAGLATLSKLSGAALLPLFLLVAVLSGKVRRSDQAQRPPPWRHWAMIAGVCTLAVVSFVAVTGWWFARNWILYGDLTGTRPILETLSRRRNMSVWVLIEELPGLFRSWWGVFGCTAPPSWTYAFYLVLVAAGAAGLVAAMVAARRHQRHVDPQVMTLLIWLALMFVAYARWNWLIHAAKGRLLYPAMVSVAVVLGRGVAYWINERAWVTPALLALLALAAVLFPIAVMAPPVSPPAIYAADDAVAPEYRLDGRFGDNIVLLGYDLGGSGPSRERAASFEPGESLDLALYWQALEQPPTHYTLAIQLASAVPGETDTLVNFNTWTGRGNYPTGAWHPGDIVVDRYSLALPSVTSRAQAWHLQAILFGGSDGRRLPFFLGGEPAGDKAVLGLLRVGASEAKARAPATNDRLGSPITFGGAVALDGARAEAAAGLLRVTLWWRSVALVAQDPIVFVHLYDTDGTLIATRDGPPISGGFPLSMWEPGDRVLDERSVILADTEAGAIRVGVGWYDSLSGARLGAVDVDGARLTSDEFVIPVEP